MNARIFSPRKVQLHCTSPGVNLDKCGSSSSRGDYEKEDIYVSISHIRRMTFHFDISFHGCSMGLFSPRREKRVHIEQQDGAIGYNRNQQ